MNLLKTFTAENNVQVSYHKVTKIEVEGAMVGMLLTVSHWVDEAQYASGAPAVWNTRVMIPIDAGLWQEIYEGLTSVDAFSGASIIEDITDTLDYKKKKKWAKVKEHRDNAEYGIFEYNGHAFDGDKDSQRRIAGAVAGLALTQIEYLLAAVQTLATEAGVALPTPPAVEQEWTTADDYTVTLDAAGLTGLGFTLTAQVANAHQIGRSIRTQIDGATDETLDSIPLWAS